MVLISSAAYVEGDAFQVEKRTVFATEWLPVAMSGQIPMAGDFTANSIGGWPVFALRDSDGTLRTFRNVCRHQNMQVVEKPAGRCSELRCRYHGWTYDLAGRFVTAPAAVAPTDAASAEHHLRELPTHALHGVVLFTLASEPGAASLGAVGKLIVRELGEATRYAGSVTSEVGCNWKVSLEAALAASDDEVAWSWPLLLARPHCAGVVVEQIVPRTFLRTRVVRHLFAPTCNGEVSAALLQANADAGKAACEALQAQRLAGTLAHVQGRVGELHERLGTAYASDVGV